jgi:serine/threonine-protein kinase
VHRDIQPRNILISRTGDVKLINFTASVDERMTTAPELLDGTTSFGAPAYMSPEQILGEPADPRSDLFSLGVVFYQMLSGDRPFDAPDQRSATQRIRHEPPPPLGRRLPGINPGVERSIVRCLQKMPADRFESAEELTQALVAAAWELGITTHRGAITSALHAARFIDQVPAEAGELAQRSTLASAAPTAKRALIGLLAASIAIVAGGTVIHAMASRTDAAAGRVPAYLELAPPDPAYLRIVADPWAHVTVDGEAVDTTPLARPLPLKAGIHHIRLEHPNAPPERRTVKLTAGETVLLDVKMQVRAANRPVVAPAAQVEEVDPDPSP